MIEWWMIYLADVCTSLCSVATLTLIVGIATGTFSCFCIIGAGGFTMRQVASWFWTKVWFTAMLVSLIICLFVPSGKVLAAMYVLPKVVNSELIQELPKEFVDYARQYVQGQLAEVKD